ncbi:MAG TPA: class I SAM-dependent methyltransferase [Dehalococcoidia bacterium]|nr:class I SAM-dependent methyltransferase [Dehalococcoidia bacterium]MDP6274383.1 class I SAM-dependent methyltransferase [Dehalococcoidia bacterium]MDP7214028.1 class I SAM-dependent methyltransferase [Dehalococcoidia bacterium]MDP7514496.1 class I SAM-dependent methyltransferase [Dehalococcoidia bacterium]HJM54032.1 class I SAM-dependent methyltransferase [Dehalococcoidia bacterium]
MAQRAQAQSAQGYSFSKFAGLDFYAEVNAATLDLAEIGKHHAIVDLSCGTGAISKQILERLEDAKNTVIFAIDHSAAALRDAKENIGERKDAVVKYVQGEVQNLSDLLGEKVDSVVYFNAIHYVPDKEDLLRMIREAIKPGGTFVFNSSFFKGAHPPETDRFARKWMMKSLRMLKREHGLRPIKSDKTEARQQLTPEEYYELLHEGGFEITAEEIHRIEVPIDGWYDISGFQDFIEGVMPGVPLEIARECLQKACKETWDEMELDTVPRNWMMIVASRA